MYNYGFECVVCGVVFCFYCYVCFDVCGFLFWIFMFYVVWCWFDVWLILLFGVFVVCGLIVIDMYLLSLLLIVGSFFVSFGVV